MVYLLWFISNKHIINASHKHDQNHAQTPINPNTPCAVQHPWGACLCSLESFMTKGGPMSQEKVEKATTLTL